MKLLLPFVLLLTSTVYGEPIITGPDTVEPGELLILDGSTSTGTDYLWIAPPGLNNLIVDNKLVCSIRTPGSYTFYLIAKDEAGLTHVEHTVTVSKEEQEPVIAVDITPTPTQKVDAVRPIIVVYTTDNCTWCDKWKNDVLPNLTGYLYTEEHNTPGIALFPSFRVYKGDRPSRLVSGYQTKEEILSLTGEIR